MATKLIEQRTERDCSLCSLAMATGLSYERLRLRVGEVLFDDCAANGTTGPLLEELLTRLGMEQSIDYDYMYLDTMLGNLRYCTPLAAWLLIMHRPALVSLPSLNQEGRHMVYWDGHSIHDPSTKKRYTNWQEGATPVLFVLLDARKLAEI